MSAALLAALLGASPAPFEAVLPAGAEATWLVRFDGKAAEPPLFGATSAGVPVLGGKEGLLALEPKARPEKLPVPVDGFAFSDGDVLAVVSGRKLGVIAKGGFTPLADLPRDGFRIASAGRKAFLLFEGKDLFRYRSGGALDRLLASPEPIDAVASNGEQTWVSAAGAVLSLEPQPARVLLAGAPVTSLAAAGGGLFYATAKEIGFAAGGKRAPFIRGATASLLVRGDRLLLHVPRTGVLSVGPIKAFASFAELAGAAKEKRR